MRFHQLIICNTHLNYCDLSYTNIDDTSVENIIFNSKKLKTINLESCKRLYHLTIDNNIINHINFKMCMNIEKLMIYQQTYIDICHEQCYRLKKIIYYKEQI